MKEIIGGNDIELASPSIKIEVNVDELIAEIERKCKYSSALTVRQHCINAALNDAILIIRKHFGKE